MTRFLKLSIILLAILMAGCQGNSGKGDSTGKDSTISVANNSVSSEFSITGLHDENDSTLLRVAILGDAEPKPLAEFPNMKAAVEQINALSQTKPVDFVIGVGDIAHKGTEIQYEAATKVLQNLKAPFYPIMGNEEHGSTVERFLNYAKKWNDRMESHRYVIKHDKLAFVFASPDHGREFNDDGVAWVLEQIRRQAPKPVILIVHGAQIGVYPENPEKGIHNQLFKEQVISQPNLAVVISGDLHMDMDRVNHSKKLDHIHYLHIPALERTKIPDESNHTTMYRVMTITKNGNVTIDTYATGESNPRDEHTYSFVIPLSKNHDIN
ncbi:MAG: metallophosphoesterase family protein [Bacteroidota bacterium]